jgi:hypothetical protein
VGIILSCFDLQFMAEKFDFLNKLSCLGEAMFPEGEFEYKVGQSRVVYVGEDFAFKLMSRAYLEYIIEHFEFCRENEGFGHAAKVFLPWKGNEGGILWPYLRGVRENSIEGAFSLPLSGLVVPSYWSCGFMNVQKAADQENLQSVKTSAFLDYGNRDVCLLLLRNRKRFKKMLQELEECVLSGQLA